MRALALVALTFFLAGSAQTLAQEVATAQAEGPGSGPWREPMTCEQAMRREERLQDPWFLFLEPEPKDIGPPPKEWPSGYLPTLDDTGGGFVVAHPAMPTWEIPEGDPSVAYSWTDVVSSRSMVLRLADNPSDSVYIEAMLFRDADWADAWIDVELSCEGRPAWDCSYYPAILVHSDRVVTVFRGAYEPHDGREGTMRMYAGMESAAQALADRLDGELIVCDWTEQTEQLLTPPPT